MLALEPCETSHFQWSRNWLLMSDSMSLQHQSHRNEKEFFCIWKVFKKREVSLDNGWRGGRVLPEHWPAAPAALHGANRGHSHHLSVPQQTTLHQTTGLYWLHKWHYGDNHHIPKSSHTKTPAFRYHLCPSCPPHEKRFEPNILHEAHSTCHRNCHSNAAFPAAWYTMQQAPGGDIITGLAATLQNHVVAEVLKLLPRQCHRPLLIQNGNFITL